VAIFLLGNLLISKSLWQLRKWCSALLALLVKVKLQELAESLLLCISKGVFSGFVLCKVFVFWQVFIEVYLSISQ
jgi:hypothetical protein